MSETKKTTLITEASWRALVKKHGFTQAEKGTLPFVDAMLKDEVAKPLVGQAMIHADHNNRKGLTGEDALCAIELTPEVPPGIYEKAKKTQSSKKRERPVETTIAIEVKN
jgi:hypothetical protein